jgi:hypothetical protein
MLAYHPITNKEIRVLQTDHSLWKEHKTIEYTKNRSEEEKLNTPYMTIDIQGKPDLFIYHEKREGEDPLLELKEASKTSKLLFVSKKIIDEIGKDKIKESKFDNLILLEEMEFMYPHLGPCWDGTIEDAVVLAAGLMRFRRLKNCWNKRAEELGLMKVEEDTPQLYWITQYYVPPKQKRRREIEKCLEINRNSKRISKIILLNEKKEGVDGMMKVEEKVIGKRITYADVMKEISKMPNNTYVAFANADIAIDDESWKNLWSINMDHKFLALLRYDVPESGKLEEAALFGPRADSQDTWIVRSDDVKELGEKAWEGLDIPFGQMGCDNAITVEMLKKRFQIVNPSLSMKTYHFHTSGIRGYNNLDVVDRPVFMYCHPTGFHELKPVFKMENGMKNLNNNQEKTIKRIVRGSDSSSWTNRMNKLLDSDKTSWDIHSENELTIVEEPRWKVNKSFSTMDGLCFSTSEMYIGEGVRPQKVWGDIGVHGMNPTYLCKRGIFTPWPGIYDKQENISKEVFTLKYLSKILRTRELLGDSGSDYEFICPEDKTYVEVLEKINWNSHKIPIISKENDIQIWAEEAVITPITQNEVCLKGDIEALRRGVKGWVEKPVFFNGLYRIVLVDDGSDLCMNVENCLEKAWDIKVIYPGRSSVDRMWDVMRGAWGIIDFTGSKREKGYESCGWNWLMPKGAYVFDVNSNSTFGLEVSSASELEHRFVKANEDDILEAVFEEEKEYTMNKNANTENKPILYVPRSSLEGYFSHPGDSFREMARLWGKRGYCIVKEHPSATMCWMNSVGKDGVLLYDRPTHEWRMTAPMNEKEWKLALFGNPKVTGIENATPWFFWPRRPAIVEELVENEIPSFSERKKNVVFYGKIENRVQEKRRTIHNWEEVTKVCEKSEWTMVKGEEKYPFTQKEYLENLRNAKFGLCLAGYGYKCHREIECMAMGCVALVAPECDMDSYHEAPIEGIHYIRIKNPEEAIKVVNEMTEERWKKISDAAFDWWKRNCSAEGSFELTMKIINSK